ncbi:membrane peptidoglycan carboxypeptidase [Luteococcus japonicus]|uniref:Membrane peptidoglycan carboxypeptidase n=1 Tax=Luteococcus japonicus TaxID=33984 RepID=A0A3N1ZVB9_9ACTN|nr:transglycosylase domain-containing protein [Luteococcus japonicus]ROR54708.1 membrane peptidoglycan carboxypeptidase [Luteococcus japonicus]
MADKTPKKPASTRAGARPAKGAKGSGGGRWKRILGIAAIGVLVMALVSMIAGLVFYNRTSLPDPNEEFTTNTTFLYYNDGKSKLGSFAVQNRQSLSYEQMPVSIKDAVVAAENRDFWTDRGISPSGIVRSAWAIARGGEVQGGSTITQQYIKVLYLSQDRTMARKLRELVLATKMGKEMKKEEILQGYLNTIYFGRGAYGIQAASKSYFNTDAKNLTVPQAAVLASVLNNPSAFDPSAAKGNKERLLGRYRYVLSGLKEAGKITDAQYAQWSKALPEFPEIPLNQRWAGTNGYLLKMVENELLAKGFTEGQIEGGGLQITTTFDEELQKRAVEVGTYYTKIVGDNSSSGAGIHPTLASVKVGTGEVQSIYGGADYLKNTRNWATTDRPAASTFKAYATVAGLRGGLSLRSSLNGNTYRPAGDSVNVRNEFGMQYGSVTLRKALAESINTAFVDMTEKIENGPEAIIKAANDAGIPKGAGWEPNGRIALGMAEVSPLENAGGFATFANDGVHVGNHVVKEVKDAKGKVIYTADTKGKQGIEQDVARDVTSALRSVVSSGTGGRVANMGFQVAGKTGTNGIERDGKNIITSAWFTAYTPQISTSVMFVAGDDGNHSLDAYARPGDSAFFGGTYPAMMWRDYMKVAMEGQDYESFPEAANVNHGQERGKVYVPPSPKPSATSTESSDGGQATQQPSATATAEQSSAPATTTPAETTPVTSTAPQTTAPAQTVTSAPPKVTQPTQPPAPQGNRGTNSDAGTSNAGTKANTGTKSNTGANSNTGTSSTGGRKGDAGAKSDSGAGSKTGSGSAAGGNGNDKTTGG